MSKIQPSSSLNPILVCGFTDGAILLYSVIPSELTFKTSLVYTAKDVHGFGVNCLDTLVLEDNQFLVASGGDDQNISVTLFQRLPNGVAKIAGCTVYAHSSCIKGLAIYRKTVNQAAEIRLCSSGYD